MRNFTRRQFGASLTALLTPAMAFAARQKVVVTRSRVVLRPGHPIARSASRTVIVRPAHRTVVVSAPVVFLPVVHFAPAIVRLPPRQRLIWQDTETIQRNEDWVESNFGVDQRGDALFIQVDGRADFDFAEVTYENGETNTVDFDDRPYGQGIYKLLDFPGRRNVKTVRLIARSQTPRTRFRLYLSA